MIRKQVLAFGKSEKSEFINIGIFAASREGVKGGAISGGLLQIGRDHMYVRKLSPITLLICSIVFSFYLFLHIVHCGFSAHCGEPGLTENTGGLTRLTEISY